MKAAIIDPVLVNGAMACRRGTGSRASTTESKIVQREKIVDGEVMTPQKAEIITTPIPTCDGELSPRGIRVEDIQIFVCPKCGLWHGKQTGPEQEYYGQLG